MNMMGNLAGFAAPWIAGIIWIAGATEFIFLPDDRVYLCGAMCWPFIDPVTPDRRCERPSALRGGTEPRPLGSG